MPDNARPIKRRPGGRTARTRRSVLDATIAELSAHGTGGLRVAAVAARSGVNESSIYRRWGSRQALLVDALLDHVDTAVPVTATGDLRADLGRLLRSLRAFYETPLGELIGRMAMGPLDDPTAEHVRRELWDRRLSEVARLLDGVDTRRPGLSERDLAELVVAPLHLRLFTLGRDVDDAYLDASTDALLATLLHDPPPASPQHTDGSH